MLKNIYIIIALLFYVDGVGQSIPKVLFLGNSYTGVNQLPSLIYQCAISAGDSLLYDENTPGGYTFNAHSSNVQSITKIKQNGWTHVVLQEQSQLPSFPLSQVQTEVFPYAFILDSLIHFSNPCAKTVLYMTWGRKFGDASNCATWPPVCTYEGMDKLLHERYRIMADTLKANLSPVGALWRYLRNQNPSLELYDADQSHPSPEGSYAAACCFYAVLYQKDPRKIAFNYSIDTTQARIIRESASKVVFDSLWYWNPPNETANFSKNINASIAQFTILTSKYDSVKWYFGDGDSSVLPNPIHTYKSSGIFPVLLHFFRCGIRQEIRDTVRISNSSNPIQIPINELGEVFPNPAHDFIHVSTFLPDFVPEIWDMNGRKVRAEMNCDVGYWNIITRSWVEGVYIISLAPNIYKKVMIVH